MADALLPPAPVATTALLDRDPRAATPVIELTDAGKTYRTGTIEFEALRGVDLRIEQGEYVAIMGPRAPASRP
ncbi:hypothetical protein [Cellulomonas soli]